jgi:hypothetical protein
VCLYGDLLNMIGLSFYPVNCHIIKDSSLVQQMIQGVISNVGCITRIVMIIIGNIKNNYFTKVRPNIHETTHWLVFGILYRCFGEILTESLFKEGQ